MNNWVWKLFQPSEVLSPAGLAQLANGNLMLQEFALDLLVEFRRFLGVPLFCNHGTLKFRGYRSLKENETIGGAPFSRHCQGIAFDLSSELPIQLLFERAKDFDRFGAIGYYPDNKFIHVDCRSVSGETVIWSA